MVSFVDDDGVLDSDQDLDQEESSTQQPESTPPAVFLATAGYDHTIRFWDVVTGVCTNTLQYNLSQVNCLAVTSDKRILGAAGNPQVHIFDTTSAAGPIRVLDGQAGTTAISGNVTALGFHTEDPWLFTTSDDGSLRIWDLRAARCQRDIDNKAGINGAVLHPNQVEIITADQNGSVKVWDLRSTVCSAEMIPEEQIPLRSVSISTDGAMMAVANNKGRVYVWKEDEGSELGYVPTSKIQAHQTFVTKCCFSPNSEYLATTSADHTVALWQFASSPLSDNVAVGSDTKLNDRWSRIEDDDESEKTGMDKFSSSIESEIGDDNLILRHSFEGHLKWVWDCAFSADSAYLVSASSDNTARLWSASSGECICIYTGHTKALTSVALNDLTLS